jgi:hypothetical protein
VIDAATQSLQELRRIRDGGPARVLRALLAEIEAR